MVLDFSGSSICGGRSASRISCTKNSPALVSFPCRPTTVPIKCMMSMHNKHSSRLPADIQNCLAHQVILSDKRPGQINC